MKHAFVEKLEKWNNKAKQVTKKIDETYRGLTV
jgi:hypothetical protein